MKRILAAVDRSEGSAQAGELAAELAMKFHAKLILIDGVKHGSPPDWAIAEHVRFDQIAVDMGQFSESLARDTLKIARAQVLACGAGPVRSEIRFGDPAREILKCREDSGADSVGGGSPRRGKLAGLLLSSVSQKMVGRAPCMVAIAR